MSSLSSLKDLPTRCVSILKGHTEAVLSVEFSNEGDYCMSGGQDGAIRLWNPSKGLFIKEYRGFHNREVFDICITRDNSRFASVGGDRFGFLCDVASGRVIRRFAGHNGRINACVFDKFDNVLFTGSHDQTLKIWDLRAFSRLPIDTLKDFKDSVTSIKVLDSEFVCASVDGKVRCYDLRKGCLTVDNLFKPIVCVTLSSEDDCLLASCLDSSIRLIDKDSGELISIYSGHTHTDYQMTSSLDPNDSFVVSGSEDGRICFWDLVEGSCKGKRVGREEEVEKLLAEAGGWMLHSHTAHEGPVFCVKFHRHTGSMLSASADKTLKLWKKPLS